MRWAVIPGHDERYAVSDHGQVRSLVSNRLLKPTLKEGYYRVTLTKPRKHYRVHRLMAMAFIPRPEGATVVRHWDDDPLNNTLSNLVWGTQGDNNRDTVRNGHHPEANKTHCKRNHEFTPENTRITNTGGRICRQCKRDHAARYRSQ